MDMPQMTLAQMAAIAQNLKTEQRSARGLAFDRFVAGFEAMKRSSDPQHKAALSRWRAEFQPKAVGVPSSAVHSNTFLANLSIQYANDEFIGSQLCTVIPVTKRSDKYATYPQRESLEFPSTAMGARSKANVIEESRSSSNYSVEDYGIAMSVDAETVANEDSVFDEMMDLNLRCNYVIAADEELRLASIFTTSSNYGTNYTTLSGTTQWDQAGSDPIKDIQTAKASLWAGYGGTRVVGFCDISTFLVLTRHPAILDNYKYNRPGLVTRQELAGLFGLDELLVSSARKQTANEGQTASYSRIWGRNFGVVRVSPRPSKRTAFFAAIFRMQGHPVTTQWFDNEVGIEGGYWNRVGLAQDEVVVAAPTGYLIASTVSTDAAV